MFSTLNEQRERKKVGRQEDAVIAGPVSDPLLYYIGFWGPLSHPIYNVIPYVTFCLVPSAMCNYYLSSNAKSIKFNNFIVMAIHHHNKRV